MITDIFRDYDKREKFRDIDYPTENWGFVTHISKCQKMYRNILESIKCTKSLSIEK